VATVGRVGVVGAGTMGSGIAIVVARAGIEAVVREVSDERLADGRRRIEDFFDGGIRRGKLTPEDKQKQMERFRWVTDLADLAECDVVIEAIWENLDAKKELFAQLNAVCRPETLFVSNTSTLSVTAMAAGSGRPEHVVGMHFCNPAPLMKLIEVSRALQTSDEAFRRAMDFGKQLGKVLVSTGDTPGFIVNRFLIPFENDCIRALEAGLGTVEDIDKAVKLGLGYPMGTFELLDVVGLDIHYEVSMSLYREFNDHRFAPPPLVSKMIEAGYLGRKSGRGFYTYEGRSVFGA
jgi:3-hydroxybutyryl-CoA dehydrogenase